MLDNFLFRMTQSPTDRMTDPLFEGFQSKFELFGFSINSNMLVYAQEIKLINSVDSFQIRFNRDGDAYGYYNIYQYQRHGKKYDYIQIGTWKE